MDGLLGKLMPRDNPVKKLQKEIESTEFKKKSLISAAQNELVSAKQRVGDIHIKIGVAVYDARNKDLISISDFAEQFKEIEEFEMILAEKESKISEITARYNEEIKMMTSQLLLVQKEQATTSSPLILPKVTSLFGGQKHCPKCGAGYNPKGDLFCVGCGDKLDGLLAETQSVKQEPKQISVHSSNNDGLTGETIQQQVEINEIPSFCGNCGTKYIIGVDVFCANCGQKIE